MAKRRLCLGAAVLALGAVINVAVAWGSAVLTDVGHGTITELFTELPPGHHWEIFRWDNAAGTRVLSKCWTGFSAGPYNHGDPSDLLTGWGRIDPPDPAAPEMQAACSQIDEAWGLPFRSMSSYTLAIWAPDGALSVTRSGVLTLRRAGGFAERGILVPLGPLWGGFLADTAFFALVVIAIRAAARDLRAVIRRRRHAQPARTPLPVGDPTGAGPYTS